MDELSLKALSRKELQALAKSRGVKATLSSADIVASLLAKQTSDSSSSSSITNTASTTAATTTTTTTTTTIDTTATSTTATPPTTTAATIAITITTAVDTTADTAAATITNTGSSSSTGGGEGADGASPRGEGADGVSPSRELREKLVLARKARMTTPKREKEKEGEGEGDANKRNFAITAETESSLPQSVAVPLALQSMNCSASDTDVRDASTGKVLSDSISSHLGTIESMVESSDLHEVSRPNALIKKLLDRKNKAGHGSTPASKSEPRASIESNEVVSSIFKSSRTIRVDNLQPPLINSDFHQWLEMTIGHKIGERYIWISPKKTHCYVFCISEEHSKNLKDKVTGLKFDFFQRSALVANYSSVLITDVSEKSKEASLSPSEWMAYATEQQMATTKYKEKQQAGRHTSGWQGGYNSGEEDDSCNNNSNTNNITSKRKSMDESAGTGAGIGDDLVDNENFSGCSSSSSSKRPATSSSSSSEPYLVALGGARSTSTLSSVDWAPVAESVVLERRQMVLEHLTSAGRGVPGQ